MLQPWITATKRMRVGEADNSHVGLTPVGRSHPHRLTGIKAATPK